MSSLEVPQCAGFGWDRVNYLPSSWYSTVFWIWNENNVENPPCQKGGGGCTGSWEGTQAGQLTQIGKSDIPYHMTS